MIGNGSGVHERPGVRDRRGVFLKRPLEHCPSCRSTRLQPVSDGETVNFVCVDCEGCWHVELGRVWRVRPKTFGSERRSRPVS